MACFPKLKAKKLTIQQVKTICRGFPDLLQLICVLFMLFSTCIDFWHSFILWHKNLCNCFLRKTSLSTGHSYLAQNKISLILLYELSHNWVGGSCLYSENTRKTKASKWSVCLRLSGLHEFQTNQSKIERLCLKTNK